MICPSVLTMLAVRELGVLAYGCLVVTMTLVWVAASIRGIIFPCGEH